LKEVDALESRLACPACAAAAIRLSELDGRCGECGTFFPVIDSLPWLFPEPEVALSEWRGRLHLLLEHLSREAALHRRDLERAHPGELTRQRLRHLASSYEDQGRRVAELLAPIGLGARQERYEVHLALGTLLPQSQGLTTYYSNVHRDWSWGEEENRVSLEAVRNGLGALDPAGALLVLGSGAGRLAYDLHQSSSHTLTVALDFNPLLATIGQRVSTGEAVELYEFPIAPRSIAAHAVLRRLAAPAPARPGLRFVLADALATPFRAGAFDVVLTPWFVDIVPDPLPALMRRLNRLLPKGGRWVVFGSLAWADRPPAECFSLEELLALAPEAGFEPMLQAEHEIPYMRSPASRHARLESAVCACFVKRREVEPAARPATRPDWLERSDVAVPALPEFREQALSTRVYAFIMAMIDGQRSIRDMAALMEQQRLMPAADAEPAIRRFLQRMHEDARRRADF